MDLPVGNIVSEIDLKASDVMLPLFECVVNSIISLKKRTDIALPLKKIQIQITRGDMPSAPDLFEFNKTIQSIKIIDNGIGFTKENFESFDTAYSRINKEYGCKGIGRFTVLAAFEKIEVTSNYVEDGEWKRRHFDFDPETEVRMIEDEPSEVQELKTTVHLQSLYNSTIKDASAKSLDSIAEDLMNHR